MHDGIHVRMVAVAVVGVKGENECEWRPCGDVAALVWMLTPLFKNYPQFSIHSFSHPDILRL